MEGGAVSLMMPIVQPDLQGATSRSKDPRTIDKVATGFESMFLTQLLKEMRQTLEPETMFGSDSGDVLGGLFDFFMAQHLAQGGSLGIAAMVKKQLTDQAHTAEKESANLKKGVPTLDGPIPKSS